MALGSCWSVVFFVATITSAQTKRPYDPKYDVFYMVDTLQHHHGNENHQVEGRDSSDNATLEKGRRVAFADEPYTPHSGNPLTRTQPHRRRSGSQDSDMTEITLTVSPISPKDTQGKKADIRLDAEEVSQVSSLSHFVTLFLE